MKQHPAPKLGYKRSPRVCCVCGENNIDVPKATGTPTMLRKMTCGWPCRNIMRLRLNDWRRGLKGGLCACKCGCQKPLSRDYVTLCKPCRTQYNNARRPVVPELAYRDWRAQLSKPLQQHKGYLEYDAWRTFWQKPCLFCNQPIATYGIDRWDSAKPYTPENTVPCCFVCNMAFGSRDKLKMLSHMAYMVAQHPETVPAVYDESEAKKTCFKRKRNNGRKYSSQTHDLAAQPNKSQAD